MRRSRLLSYAPASLAAPLASITTDWSDARFESLISRVGSWPAPAALLQIHMERRGYDANSLADAVWLRPESINAFLDGKLAALRISDLQTIGHYLGADYRLFIEPSHRNDALGKTWQSIEASRGSSRPFRGYSVASMATSTRHPDLVGLFLRVSRAIETELLDLEECGHSFYFVSCGDLSMRYRGDDGELRAIELHSDDSVFVSALVPHAFFGTGSLIKLGGSPGLSYLEQYELSNTFQVSRTLEAGRAEALKRSRGNA